MKIRKFDNYKQLKTKKMERTKKFNGETYKLVSHPTNVYFSKTEKEKKVTELKQKGFS